MKHTKKLAGILLAIVLMFSMVTPAFAATIKNESGLDHDYVAYQIFTGTQSDTGELADVQWGNGVDSDALLADADLIALVGDVADAAALAEKVATFENDSDNAKAFAKIVYAHLAAGSGTALDAEEVDVASGYYLIVDETNLSGANDANNLALLQITDTITITDKTGVPTVDKKVNDGNGNYGETADYSIGDEIEFTLTATLPDNLENFEEYTLIFHDTMSDALDFDSTSVTVTANGTTVAAADYQTDAAPADTDTFDVTIADALSLQDEAGNAIALSAGDTVVVTYKATLNDQAVIGSTGNDNKVVLEFSNNPNQEQTGKTPESRVVVFTYELDVAKVDKATQEALTGAEFKLADEDGMYVTVDANNVVTGWTADADAASVLTSDADGKFIVKGLDQGTYSLYETKAPSGYNTPENPFTLIITATGTAAGVTTLNISVDNAAAVDGDTVKGIVNATIENSKGSLLPSTGGIGTTIFYAAGAVVIVAAVVLLIVSKKRRGNSEINAE